MSHENSQSTQRIVALVGHCGPDVYMLRNAVRRFVPDAEIVTADDVATATRYAGEGALLLVNRVLDGHFANEDGIEFIRQNAGKDDQVRAMLISNFPQAQAEAVAAGALPGFGKLAVNDASTGERLRQAWAETGHNAR